MSDAERAHLGAAAGGAGDSSGSRYRAIFESAVDFAIIATDRDGLVTDWNTGAERIFGWSAEEMRGEAADRLFTPEDRAEDCPADEMRRAIETGRASDERWHVRRDGSRFWAHGEMMPLRGDDGAHLGYLKILRDRTEQRRAAEALRASEERLRIAQRAGGIGTFEWYPDTGKVDVSDEYRRIWGLAPGVEVTADLLVSLIHPDDRALAGPARLQSDENPLEYREYRVTRPDTGEERWIARRGEVVPAAGGASRRLIGVAFDITERKRSAEMFRLHAEEFQTLADNIPTLCWMAHADGRIHWYNRRWYEYTGTDPESQEGWGWESVHDPEILPQVVERWRRSLATGEPFEMTFPLRRADGVFRPFLTRVVPIRGGPDAEHPDGRIARWFGANTDITRQREAEQALRELNETLERRVEERTRERDRLWRNSQDLLVVIDTQGMFRAVNPAATTILGWAPDEMLGHTVFDFIVPDDLPSTRDALERAAQDVLPTFENRYRHKDGGSRWISWVAGIEEGLIYASGRNVTAEKEAAAALEATREQLRQSQKMEAVGQLTGGLAHDFNNLLTGITGSLELLQTRIAQGRVSDVDRYVTAAQGAAKRAAMLTHRLLAFSRRQTLDPKPVNINRLITGMEELIRRTMGPAVEIEVVGAGGLWTTLVDPNQLENALLNLCINARDAMPDGGRLTIETENKWLDGRTGRERDLLPGQYLSLCVTDTGTGMTPEVIERAFDPFFTTKPLGLGTGLGLSMVYGFARQSGGQVRIYSELGRGTTMCLYLPRHHGPESDTDAAPEPAGVPAAEQGKAVLVVDDEPTVRMLVSEVLEDLGYMAIEAADGAAGLKVLHSDARVDLLITDVGLPGGMNGRQVADAGRAVRPELKVLFITGYAENAAVGNGHLDPGMQVLTKPFAMEALASRIKNLIAKT